MRKGWGHSHARHRLSFRNVTTDDCHSFGRTCWNIGPEGVKSPADRRSNRQKAAQRTNDRKA